MVNAKKHVLGFGSWALGSIFHHKGLKGFFTKDTKKIKNLHRENPEKAQRTTEVSGERKA
jgi:hypothetical protein